MAEAPRDRGLLDTSVLIDMERIDPASLPAHVAVSALTMAELAARPHATRDEGLSGLAEVRTVEPGKRSS